MIKPTILEQEQIALGPFDNPPFDIQHHPLGDRRVIPLIARQYLFQSTEVF